MTKDSLSPGRKRLIEMVERMNFGWIEQLVINDGEPCFGQAHRIVEDVKLNSRPTDDTDLGRDDFTINKEFENLFAQFERLRNGTVDIEIRHFLPFRLTILHPREGSQL